MVPSARRPLRVRRWDGYALVSENRQNTSRLLTPGAQYRRRCHLLGPWTARRFRQTPLRTQHAYFGTSRDGLNFKRWPEAFIRPGPRFRESWVYGDNYVFWGMVETPSATEDAPREISMYACEGYWEGISNSVRRYTLRQDGFVSVAAPLSGGEIVTKPIVFEGGNLTLNVETSGAGGVQVEIQDEAGTPIEGYGLDDCPAIFCDSLRRVVRWKKKGGDVRALAGEPVRLMLVLRDADLYALQFVPYEPDPAAPDLNGIELPKQDA